VLSSKTFSGAHPTVVCSVRHTIGSHVRDNFRLHRMHEMQTIVTNVHSVCLSVCLLRGFINSASLCWGHSVQLLPNHWSLVKQCTLTLVVCLDYDSFGNSMFLISRSIGLCFGLLASKTYTVFTHVLPSPGDIWRRRRYICVVSRSGTTCGILPSFW